MVIIVIPITAMIIYLILRLLLSQKEQPIGIETKNEEPKLTAPPTYKPQEKTVLEDGITYIIRDGFWFRQFVFDDMTLELCVKYEEEKKPEPLDTGTLKKSMQLISGKEGITIHLGKGVEIDGTFYPVDDMNMKREAHNLERYAERTEDGILHREILGVHCNYTFRFRWKEPGGIAHNAFLDAISTQPNTQIRIVGNESFADINSYISGFDTQISAIGEILTLRLVATEPEQRETVEEWYVNEPTPTVYNMPDYRLAAFESCCNVSQSHRDLELAMEQCCCSTEQRINELQMKIDAVTLQSQMNSLQRQMIACVPPPFPAYPPTGYGYGQGCGYGGYGSAYNRN